MLLLAYTCSIIFSFLYQFCNQNILKLQYLYSRSHCDFCHTIIKPLDLLPIISFLKLRGQSRCCNQPLQRLYLIGELVSFGAIFLYYPTHFNIHFTLFLTTFLFLLTMCLYDIHSMHIDMRLLFVYTVVSVFTTQTYFGNFIMIFLISHVIYLFASKFIGYGDILLFNILGLIFPLNFFFFIVVFTFIIGGIFAIILKIFSFKDIKYLPLIPFIFISFVVTSLVYRHILFLLGGEFY